MESDGRKERNVNDKNRNLQGELSDETLDGVAGGLSAEEYVPTMPTFAQRKCEICGRTLLIEDTPRYKGAIRCESCVRSAKLKLNG